jgi:hypothetical protein
MNVNTVIENLIAEEKKTIDGIDFKIKRFVDKGFIIKQIDFEDEGKKFHFEEKVRAYSLPDFQQMMEKNGIYLLDTFGDYKLSKFYKNTSERLILIFK